MRLKVRCQKCGRGKVIVTSEPGPWYFFTAPDVLPDLQDYLNWMFWLCPKCGLEFEHSEDPEEFFKSILKVTVDEWKEKEE